MPDPIREKVVYRLKSTGRLIPKKIAVAMDPSLYARETVAVDWAFEASNGSEDEMLEQTDE